MEVGTSTEEEEERGSLIAGISFVGVVVAMVTSAWEVRGDEVLDTASVLLSGVPPADRMD